MNSLATFRTSTALHALALGLLLALTMPSRAAEFDSQLKSPALVSQERLKTQLRGNFDRAASLSIPDRLRLTGMQWIDLTWQLNRMAQAGEELPDLSEFGLQKQADGSYVLDHAKNPQWGLWYRVLTDLQNPGFFEGYANRLRDRGFRDRDIQVMKEYVAAHQPRRAVVDGQRVLIQSVKAQRSRTPRLAKTDATDAALYVYQLDRAREAALQLWAAGLLSRLDEQRQRALASYCQEISGVTLFLPDSNFDQSIQMFAEVMTSGRYEQQLLQQEQESRP